jgi:23S rRNA G2445 N2-methylase RlmL
LVSSTGTRIVAFSQKITAEYEFATLELAAAGAESAVMQRIATTLAERLKLRVVPSEGDLQVRVRPSQTGWDVLLRLTPRPLGTRAWRVCTLPRH